MIITGVLVDISMYKYKTWMHLSIRCDRRAGMKNKSLRSSIVCTKVVGNPERKIGIYM